jgi:Cytochrome c554 and c-prime
MEAGGVLMKRHCRLLAVLFIIVFPVIFFSTCIQKGGEAEAADVRGPAYAGSAACLSCHKNIADSFSHTAHALTSRMADLNTVKGIFTPPDNEFVFGPGHEVVLQQRDSGLYQAEVVKGKDGGMAWTEAEAHRFDIAVGSGRKAQTFLYWKGDQAFQLPVSYFVAEHNWANSPHFPMDHVWFGREISKDCFGCHSSYIKEKDPIYEISFHKGDRFDRTRMIYGIDCERCHGPGAQHVAWQDQHPAERSGKFITRFASLSRQQRLDACAVCHSGLHSMQRSVFAFLPGDSLSNFYSPEKQIAKSTAAMDVHGNQYQLLTASQCFLKSKTLDCATCHDAHSMERDNLALFSQRCMTCHTQPASHPATGLDVKMLAANCIDCHMPAQPSKAITMQTQGLRDPVADLVRNHLITIYPDATKAYLEARK